MRLLFGLVLIAGLGLAGFAVYMAQNYIGAYENALQEERAKVTKAVPTQMIYVSSRPIAYGEELTDADIRLVPWPKEILPVGYFDDTNPIIVDGEKPRVVLRPMEANEAFMPVKVSEPGGDAGLTSRLEKGQRAFAIKVDVASGVSGFLRPGDRVDVYWTGRIPGNDPNLPQGDVTKLIQSGIRLIAVDQTATSDNTDATIARTVTVAASPTEIAGLAQAQSTGKLSLSLMGINDDTVAEAIEVDQRSLLGITKVEQNAENSLEVCTIRTRRGADVVEIPIPCTD
ncbi:Flp pilus assembly protein CpaB [Thalassococcus sp. CAU 1522]|uniref:Flp pilus assembly protein CpaB n=1 Tax=Thalassococcus arenae TaxID=2851652 RepID=A0ABS6NDM5_9RHOB|nr:Flp pilus assembly protein CpaB [Thalassococcus arenae]MBV2361680.1 Flp pilus assembly protein CpaB [Thalassococcus arenae]